MRTQKGSAMKTNNKELGKQGGLLNLVSSTIVKAAKKYKVKPYEVTSAQFWTTAGDTITEWEIRKLGGFTGIRSLEFPAPLDSSADEVLPQVKQFKPAKRKLENFTSHTVKLADLFKMAGLKDNQVFKVIVQPDTHVPEHDQSALNVVYDFANDYKPHGWVNLGDFLECEPVSHWPSKTAKPLRFTQDVLQGRKILQNIDDASGKQLKFKRFLIGNHEDWLDQYLIEKIPELYDGIEELGTDLSVQGLLKLKDFDYRTVPLNEVLSIGHANFIHGYYTAKNHASQHLNVFGCNIYYGHLHDIQSHSSSSVKGLHEAMSLGCLRTLNASFLKGRPNNWSHAFGVFEFRKDGSYSRVAPVIVNGVMSYNGKIYNGNR